MDLNLLPSCATCRSRVVRDDKVPMCNVPVPRYGHSFVHDSLHHIFYMFGGNAGSDNHSKTLSTMRLDDFWELEVTNIKN